MKKWILIIPVIALLSFTVFSSLDPIIEAFKSGKVEQISPYLDESLEINIDGKTHTYTKKDALVFLKGFFASHAVTSFKIIHKSESTGSAYFIGNLVTSDGTFRTTLYVKDKSGSTLLQEIRFEK